MTGYLVVSNVNNKHLGGLLVVNEFGVPEEFKYTEPVTPTKLQEIIYGSSLFYYLHVEIIAKTLLQKSEARPEVVLVEDPNLLFEKNVLLISRLPHGVPEKREGNEAIINAVGVAFKLVASEGQKLEDSTLERLRELASRIDIFEPFERVEKALHFVCESQER